MKTMIAASPFLIAVVCLLMNGVGCAGYQNACVIEATIQEKRLTDAGLEAHVGMVQLENRRHAVCVWTDARKRRWVWDRGGSMQVCGDEQEIARVVGFRWDERCEWIGWLAEPKKGEK